MGAAYQDLTARAPENISTPDWTITVDNGNYVAGPGVQQFDLSSYSVGSGRWVLVRVKASAGSITSYAGATITNAPPNRTVVGVSRENVNYSGVTYDCIVVTLA